jgi:hypothetical protein
VARSEAATDEDHLTSKRILFLFEWVGILALGLGSGKI